MQVLKAKSYLQWWNFGNFLEPNVEESKIKFQILFIDWFYWLSVLVYKSNNPILPCNVIILVSISIRRPWRRSMKPLKVILLPTKIEWNKLLLLHRNLSKFDSISILGVGGSEWSVLLKKKNIFTWNEFLYFKEIGSPPLFSWDTSNHFKPIETIYNRAWSILSVVY